jgi:hypothetical protein
MPSWSHIIVFSLKNTIIIVQNNPLSKSHVATLPLYRHAFWQFQEVIVTTFVSYCYVVMTIYLSYQHNKFSLY